MSKNARGRDLGGDAASRNNVLVGCTQENFDTFLLQRQAFFHEFQNVELKKWFDASHPLPHSAAQFWIAPESAYASGKQAEPADGGLLDRLVSTYDGISPVPTNKKTVREVLADIKAEILHDKVIWVREAKGDKAEYRERKKTLPSVSFGGLFSRRANDKITHPTGVITADLDHLKHIDDVFILLTQDPYAVFAFMSPGGDGIKGGFYAGGIATDADHKRLFAAIERYFREVYGITIDLACKDISRLTFLSSDPDLHINPEALPFPIDEWLQPEQTEQQPESPLPPPEPQPAQSNPESHQGLSGKALYAWKVLQSACDRIRRSQPTQQHPTRLREARLVGGYLHHGLNEAEVLAELEAAVRDSGAKDMAAAMKTVRDGLEYGKLVPIEIPDLPGSGQGRPGDDSETLTKADFEEIIRECEDHDNLIKGVLKQIVQTRLTSAETNILMKLIAKKVGCSLKDLQADAKRFEPSAADLQLLHAKSIIKQIGQENIITTAAGTRGWRGKGFWENMEDRIIKQICHQVMPIDEVTKSEVESVVDLVKTETYRPGHEWDFKNMSINVLNGELHFNGELWELKEHCREHYRTTQLPVYFDPEAACPRFDQFLDEIFSLDGMEAVLKKKLVCQMFGYSLLATARYEKFFLLVGPGANGKSVLLDLLIELVGIRQTASIQPSQLVNQFYRAHLYGKLINVVSELKAGAEIADDNLKKVTSGEVITADQKFKPPFEFSPYCTCIFATNHLPQTKDFSEALFRRALMLDFTRTFKPSEQDVTLKDQLKAELSGVLNLALQGIAEVFRTGRFTEPRSSIELKKRWRFETDHVAEFVNERCKFDPDAWTTSNEIYQAYRFWSEAAGIKNFLTRRTFGERVRLLGVESKRGTGGARGYRITLIAPHPFE